MARFVDPFAEFHEIFEHAKKSETADPTRCALATADSTARPTVRMVLLKSFDERGFVFYTNLGSRKVSHLRSNPQAELCFHWPIIKRQIRIAGHAEQVDDQEADHYFASRPRGSQIGAWTSAQSQPLGSRKELVARYLKIQARFAGKTVPRPDFWSGFRVVPDTMEFWYDQLHRLHDRFLCRREDGRWDIERLYP